jgi:ABC-type Mn2+/Zn2+ transport system permease subunit
METKHIWSLIFAISLVLLFLISDNELVSQARHILFGNIFLVLVIVILFLWGMYQWR